MRSFPQEGKSSQRALPGATAIRVWRLFQVSASAIGFPNTRRLAFYIPKLSSNLWLLGWAAEQTDYADEVSEAALAHVMKDKVKAAYLLSDFFEKRRHQLEDWAKFCQSESKK